jgi:hypothetical protein
MPLLRMRLFALCFAVLSLSALAADIDQSKYLPLNPGDEWIMDTVITTPKGKTVNATTRRKTGDTVVQDGKTYFRTSTAIEGVPKPVETIRLIRKDRTGLYSVPIGDKDAKEEREIVLPLVVGQHWQRTKDGQTVNESVIGVETVAIGEKTYENCYHIRTEIPDKGFREDYWEAPVVGDVKSELVYRNGTKITMTLREFKSGKP